MRLLDNRALEQSPVVANCRMNRERQVAGVNSYGAELRLDPIAFLEDRLTCQSSAAWLDLCCGTGKALIQAGRHFQHRGEQDRVRIAGIDLVRMFDAVPQDTDCVSLEAASLHDWQPDRAYDLITCVHGLHYIGDKLGLVVRAASWLAPDGLFLSHLDIDNLKTAAVSWTAAHKVRDLQEAGLQYNRNRRLITCRGRRSLVFPWKYEGADDAAGPNATGQPAVDSYYSRAAGGAA
jgi:trans-aconitate methyltransferase